MVRVGPHPPSVLQRPPARPADARRGHRPRAMGLELSIPVALPQQAADRPGSPVARLDTARPDARHDPALREVGMVDHGRRPQGVSRADPSGERRHGETGSTGPRGRPEAECRGGPCPAGITGALNYLLCQADTGLMCAIGRTSGVVGLVERFAPPEVRERLLARLTAERFEDAWDGAMFMTEQSGGSDLGTITTTARQSGGGWRLTGSKWFCSNIDAGAIATLARPEGAPAGLKGIALFVVPRSRADGSPNGIHMRRLKDKLGTRPVPTGEVDFVDAEAHLLAGSDGNGGALDGRGINRMMEMVNPSRFGVACMGLGLMRRAFLEAAIYAARREAFGHRLEDLPLARETLLRMLVDLEAAATLVFGAGAAIGRTA